MGNLRVDLSRAYKSAKVSKDLAKELKTVERMLNISSTPDLVNLVNNSIPFVISKVKVMLDQGLSYLSDDYYIFPRKGGGLNIKKSPNGMMSAMSRLAEKAGFIANINVGCVFDGYEEFSKITDGINDELVVRNNPKAELMQAGGGTIIAPYCVVTLFIKGESKPFSKKVTIVRHEEYTKAKQQGGARSAHASYPVPMATKIALFRAGQALLAMFGYYEGEEADDLRRELNDHKEDHPVNNTENVKDIPATKIQDDPLLVAPSNSDKNDVKKDEVKKIDFNSI